MVGNKIDKDEHAIDRKEAKEMAKRNGLFYVETSAKTSEGIAKLFEKIAEEILKSK